MAGIVRTTQEIFSTTGTTPSGGFGAPAAGNPSVEAGSSNSPANIMTGVSGAWAGGWSDATEGASNFPTFQDMNAVLNTITYQLAYLLERGIPEYDVGTSYNIGDITRASGGTVLYNSLTDANIGNALSDGAAWNQGLDVSVPGVPTGAVFDFAGSSAPSGYLMCYGQLVNIATYPALYAVLGTTYGSAAGQFGIPDYRGKVGAGVDNMGGSAANLITSAVCGISGTTLGANGGDQNLSAHTHTATVTDAGHAHTLNVYGGGSGGSYVTLDTPDSNGTPQATPSTNSNTTGITVSNSTTSSGVATNVRPTIMTNKIIKT